MTNPRRVYIGSIALGVLGASVFLAGLWLTFGWGPIVILIGLAITIPSVAAFDGAEAELRAQKREAMTP